MNGVEREGVVYSNSASRVTVYRGVLSNGGIPVAVKEQVHGSVDEANAVLKTAMMLSKLNDPSIMRLYDARIEENKRENYLYSVLVLELMDKPLYQELNERQVGYTDEELLKHLICLTKALCAAKKDRISHRALGLDTVFVAGGRLKLGGFSSSADHYDGLLTRTTIPVPSLYISPELRSPSEKQYNPFQADVYSLGLILLTMARMRQPEDLEYGTDDRQMELVLRELPQYPNLTKILAGMLKTDPQERLAFETILEHLEPHLMDMAEAVVCETCHQEVRDHQWTRKVYKLHSENFCSLACYSRSLPPECQHCQSCASQLELDAVFLTCGHSFHNKDCFFAYLTQASQNFSQVVQFGCPACGEKIPQGLIYFTFGKTEFEQKENEVYTRLCNLCRRQIGNTAFASCGHRSCRQCVKTLFFLDLCPICRGSK